MYLGWNNFNSSEKNAEGYVRKYFEDNGKKIREAEVSRLATKCQGAKKNYRTAPWRNDSFTAQS